MYCVHYLPCHGDSVSLKDLVSVRGYRGLSLPCYVKRVCFSVTSSCLSLSSCKQCTRINWRVAMSPGYSPLYEPLWRRNVKCQCRQFRSKRTESTLLKNATKIKSLLKRRPQEMLHRWNNMWKIKWLIGVFMIAPCCSLTVSISLVLSRCILLSALRRYIATVGSRFSCKPVHHLISLALSNAWLAKRSIYGDFMNKSVAINFDYNQKPMQCFNKDSFSKLCNY